MNKASSYSQRKIKHSPMKSSDDFSASKSHLLSTHQKTQDLYSNIYRLPLKQILQQRRQQDRSYSQRKQKMEKLAQDTHPNSDFKTKHNPQRSSRKMSIHQPLESSMPLRTDRSSKDFLVAKAPLEYKRIKTELQHINQEDIETVPHRKSRSKAEIHKKQYVSIKLQDMMALLATYSKLKSRNTQLTNQLGFYYKEMEAMKEFPNSVLKALNI